VDSSCATHCAERLTTPCAEGEFRCAALDAACDDKRLTKTAAPAISIYRLTGIRMRAVAGALAAALLVAAASGAAGALINGA
jgi:hypothetical protein